MTIETLTSLIGTMGFPIVMCLVVCWYVKQKDETHKQEIDKLSDAVAQQTLSIQRLIDKIDIMIGGVKNGD